MFEGYDRDLLLFVKALIPTFATQSLRKILRGSQECDVLIAAVIAATRTGIANPAGYFKKILKDPDGKIELRDVLDRLEAEVATRRSWRARNDPEHNEIRDEIAPENIQTDEMLSRPILEMRQKDSEESSGSAKSQSQTAERADVLAWYKVKDRKITQLQALEAAQPILDKRFSVKKLTQELDQAEFNLVQRAARSPGKL